MGIEEVKGPKGVERLKQVLGFSRMDRQSILQMTECYMIPYPCPDFARVKLHYKINGAKYLSPKKEASDTAFHLYFLKDEQEKLTNPKYALIITEGEKKTAKLTQELRKLEEKRKVVAIGVPGITMWRDCPEWKEIRLSGRDVYQCFDGDFRDNPDVQSQMLTNFLWLRKHKTNIKVIIWDNGKGIDDYLVIQEQGGINPSEALLTLLDHAENDIFHMLSHMNYYKLADACVNAFYSVEEDCKALWDEFKLKKSIT